MTTTTDQFPRASQRVERVHVAGTAKISTNGILQVGDDLGGLTVEQDLTLDSSGKLVVGTDVTGPVEPRQA